jgi:ADP-ribose pyrophosphatase YjhB (NUDIX family)
VKPMPEKNDPQTALGRIAADRAEMPVPANGGDWMVAWHPPAETPPGEPFGANAFCVTREGDVVLVSEDGRHWGWPGGRPEYDESWEQTLRRGLPEEACVTVAGLRLLGFVRSRCVSGEELGLVVIHSIWLAQVAVLPWQPEYEMQFRRLVPARSLAEHLWMEPGSEPIYSRAAREAALA